MTPLLEIDVVVNAETITALGVMMTAVISGYVSAQNRKTHRITEDTHKIVNSQRTEMQDLIEKLKAENVDLRRDDDLRAWD